MRTKARELYIVIDKYGDIVDSARTARIARLTPLQSGDMMYKRIRKS